MSRYQYHACERCGCPGVETAYRYCGRCAAVREPGSDDVPAPRRCIHCRSLGTKGSVCPSCQDLLAWHGGGLSADGKADEKADNSSNKKSVCLSASSADSSLPSSADSSAHNGYWLYHDARKAGDLDQVVAYGREHGFPRMMKDWSRVMVSRANQARSATTTRGS